MNRRSYTQRRKYRERVQDLCIFAACCAVSLALLVGSALAYCI